MILFPMTCKLPSNLKYKGTLVGREIVDHSDVVEQCLSVLLKYIFILDYTWLQGIGQRQLQDETKNIQVLGFGASCTRSLMVNYA